MLRYSLSVNARIVSLWMAPFEASDRTAFATAVSSGASTVQTISYWPITMKNSFRVTPADSNIFRAASNRDGLSLTFSSPLLSSEANKYTWASLLPPGVIVCGEVDAVKSFRNPRSAVHPGRSGVPPSLQPPKRHTSKRKVSGRSAAPSCVLLCPGGRH